MKKEMIEALEAFVIRVANASAIATPEELHILPEVAMIVLDNYSLFKDDSSPDK